MRSDNTRWCAGEDVMRTDELVAGWRGLAIAVSERLGRSIGAGRVRWRVESSGLAIGTKLGGTLLFDSGDVEATARLVDDADRHAAPGGW